MFRLKLKYCLGLFDLLSKGLTKMICSIIFKRNKMNFFTRKKNKKKNMKKEKVIISLLRNETREFTQSHVNKPV